MAESKPIKEEVTKGYQLTLSIEEAKTLKTILYKVGGSHLTTNRKHADAISTALSSVSANYDEASGSIIFRTEDEIKKFRDEETKKQNSMLREHERRRFEGQFYNRPDNYYPFSGR
jgi:hypothetical protein